MRILLDICDDIVEDLTPRRIKRWKSGDACCPACRRGVVKEDNFCSWCGQALDWTFD